MLKWYIAKSKPRKESVLISNLNQRGVQTFYPQIRIPRAKSGSNRMEPLFPTYVFCFLDPSLPTWLSTRWAPGVSYFLNIEGQPTSVPESFIEYLQRQAQKWNQGGFQRSLVPGERVTIIRGPMSGMEAIFKSYLSARQRCEVLLQTMSRIVPLEIPRSDLADLAPISIRSGALA